MHELRKKITLPNSLEKIDSTTFRNCSKLTNINIGENNKNFVFQDGILMDAKMEEMIVILESAINGNIFTIPNGIKD